MRPVKVKPQDREGVGKVGPGCCRDRADRMKHTLMCEEVVVKCFVIIRVAHVLSLWQLTLPSDACLSLVCHQTQSGL